MNDKITNRDMDEAINKMLNESVKASKSVAMNCSATEDLLNIDEAIAHAKQVANSFTDIECACAQEHKQLALWLEELKEYRNYKV